MEMLLHSGARFEAFQASHLAVLVLSLVLGLVLVASGRTWRQSAVHRWLPRALGALIVVSEIVFVMYPVYLGTFGWHWGLPLQLCDVTALVIGVALMFGLQFGLEWGYFLGLSATLLTTATPDLEHDFPHVEFWCFFLTHALVAVTAAYAVFGLDRRPRPRAAVHVWIAVNLYGLAMVYVNTRLHANYLYICRKPGVNSPFDYLGPWPHYVVALDVILAGFLAGLTLIAAIVPVLAEKDGPGHTGHVVR